MHINSQSLFRKSTENDLKTLEQIIKMNMKILLILILISFSSCNLQEKKQVTEQKDENIVIALAFHPSAYTPDSRYIINICNDSLHVEKRNSINNTTNIRKLTHIQVEKLQYLFSNIKTKHKQLDEVEDAWGATLIINDVVYYEDYDFSFNNIPQEYQELINYIVSLSTIKIDLYGFA